MDARRLAKLATEQSRNARRIRTVDKRLKGLTARVAELGRERDRLLGRNEAIDAGLKGLEGLLRDQPETPAPVRIHREVTGRDQVMAAIGRKGLDEFGATEIAAELGFDAKFVLTELALLSRAGRLHRVGRGRYRVQRGRIAS